MRSLIAWSALSVALMAQTQVLMMRDVIHIALESNPEMKIRVADSQSSKARLDQMQSYYLPHAGLSAGGVYSDRDTLGTDTYEMGELRASQLLYDFGKTSGLIDGGEQRYEASKSDITATQNDTIYNALKEYYTVLKQYHLIAVQQESVEITDQQLYRAREYFKAGVRTKIDVTNAQLELSDAQLALLSAKNNLKIARVNLERIMGLSPNGGDYRLYNESMSIDQLKTNLPRIPHTLEEFKAQALVNRSELSSARSRIEASRADESSASGDYFPSLDAKAVYQTSGSDLPGTYDQWNAGVYLNWEFFSGFATQAKVQEARSNTLSFEAERQKIALDIITEVTNAYNTAMQEREAIDIRELAVSLARENLQLAQERYKSGIGDMIELNDAQSKYIEAKSNYVVTYYDYCIAAANIQHAVGKMAE